MTARRPPLGSVWRILAHGRMGPLSTVSYDMAFNGNPPSGAHVVERKRTIFDELVIEGVLHVEQMRADEWWIGIPTRDGGLIHVDIWVDKRARAARSVMVRDDRDHEATTRCELRIDARREDITGRAGL